MEWEYNDYELDNRLNNMMWTISEDYGEESNDLKRYANVSKDLAIYFAVKTGARKKYVDWLTVKKYISYKARRGVNPDILVPFVEICLDIMVEDKLIEERPGVKDIRNKGYEELLKQFLKTHSSTLMEKIRYAWVFEQMGKSVQFDRQVKGILRDMLECKTATTTKEVIVLMEKIYTKHFSQEEDYFVEIEDQLIEQVQQQTLSEDNNGDFQDFLYEELYKDNEVSQEISEVVDNMNGSLLVESLGDFSKDTSAMDNRRIFVDQETADKIYDKISYYYGDPFLSKEEVRNIERKVCSNAHDGCRIHFTDGVLRTDNDNAFQKKFVSRQRENNLSFYAQNPRVNKRNITKLKQMILRTMIAESEVTKIPSDNGVIVANKLWKIGRSKDTKVFNKVLKNEKGGYVVDILLDASGSQRMNQGHVASQAYIISEALTLASIPNRVMGFSSFLDYTILRRYRNYDSPRSENKNIFEYYSAGNNRDGLAIQSVAQGLLKREEENKIMIILSDGKPNDIIISKVARIGLKGKVSYKGAAAIKDTALEVRKARKSGILVLGVFTGKEEDLHAEKFIYGKDFIYTKNVDRFADIVGTFLKRVIENY